MSQKVTFGTKTFINETEKAWVWYSYNIEQLKTSLDKNNNGLIVNEEEFTNIKGFIYSRSGLDTYKMEFENNDEYFYILHHALRLYDNYCLSEQHTLPDEFISNENRYKDTMISFVRNIAYFVPDDRKKEVSLLIKTLGCETERYVNRRNKIVNELLE
jgi:hypothetical protein